LPPAGSPTRTLNRRLHLAEKQKNNGASFPPRYLSLFFLLLSALSHSKSSTRTLFILKREKKTPKKRRGVFKGDKGGFSNTLKFWVILLTAVSKIGTQNLVVFEGRTGVSFFSGSGGLFFVGDGKPKKP